MALSESPASGGALVAPESTNEKHTHAKEGGGRYTHAHDNAADGHKHTPADDNNESGVALMPLPKSADDELDAKEWQFGFDIKSVEENSAGTLILEGYANTWDLDRDGEKTAKNAFDRSLDEFMQNPVVLFGHKENHQIGYVTDAKTDAKGLWVRAEIPKPPTGTERWHVKVYSDIKNRVLRAFSMGGKFYRSKSIKGLIERVALHEVSVVGIPANQTSIFALAGTKGLHFNNDESDADENANTLLARRQKENGMADNEDTKSITVDKTEWEAMQKTLGELASEKKAADLKAEAEEEAKKLVEAEAKAAADAEAEKKALIDAAVAELRGTLTSGKKFRPTVVSGSHDLAGGKSMAHFMEPPPGEKREGGYKSFGGFLRDVRDSHKGDSEAYKRAKDLHLKSAEFYATDEDGDVDAKALAEGTNSAGGFLVPPQYYQNGIAEYRLAAAKVSKLVTQVPVTSNQLLVPRETGVPTVGWTAENAGKPSTDATFGQLAVNVFTLAGISKVSNQVLNDSAPSVDVILKKDLGRVLAQAVDIAEINGSGSGQPTGILNTTGVLSVAFSAPAQGSGLLDALSSAIGAIDANFFDLPTAALVPPRMVTKLRNVKDTTGRPILEPGWMPGASPFNGGAQALMAAGAGSLPGIGNNPLGASGFIGTIWGMPVFSDANIPTNLGGGTNESPIIVGVWPEAWELERQGVTIDVSSEAGTAFEQNQTWFRGEMRIGFTAARQPTAFCQITGLTAAIAG